MLLEKSGYIDINKSDIKNKCLSLKRILISSIKTCKLFIIHSIKLRCNFIDLRVKLI